MLPRVSRALARAVGGAVAVTAGMTAAWSEGGGGPSPVLPVVWTRNLATGDGKLFQEALGVDPQFARDRLANMMLFSGKSNPELAEEICYQLSITAGRVALDRFADGEVSIQVLENVRGKDVYIVQSTSQPVNENLMELLLLISTMRRASARSITAVIPYYGYKRDVGTVSQLTHQLRSELVEQLDDEVLAGVQDATPSSLLPPLAASHAAASTGGDSSFPVSAADVAKMLQAVGVDRVIAVDLQPPSQGQVEGFFGSTPVENLRTTELGVDYIARLDLTNPVVVAPNEACIQLAGDFADALTKRLGVDKVGVAATIEAGPSRGTDRYGGCGCAAYWSEHHVVWGSLHCQGSSRPSAAPPPLTQCTATPARRWRAGRCP